MDEYDSDEEVEGGAGSDTVGTAYPFVMRSPDSSVRHKVALSKAKSFRGQKLYSLIQTPSSVFDCPTPQSRDAKSMDFSFSGSDSGAVERRGNLLGEPALGSIEEALVEDTHRIDVTTVASPLVPSRALESQLAAAPGSPRLFNKSSPGKSHRQMLSIETMTLTGVTAAADSQRQSLSSLTATDAVGDVTQTNTSDGAAEGISTDPMPRRNKDYASLTEKNVNLNILRTASSDVARALQMPGRKPSFMRQPLAEVLSACKILVVDGE
jgi:hypothetical protein